MNDTGHVSIVDRRKYMILTTGGYNVYPAEIGAASRRSNRVNGSHWEVAAEAPRCSRLGPPGRSHHGRATG
jgi:acyl-CoA synthetase (AMP-forming)/AMP-acid ligase II